LDAHVLVSGCHVPSLHMRVRDPYVEPAGHATVAVRPEVVEGHTPSAGQFGMPHSSTPATLSAHCPVALQCRVHEPVSPVGHGLIATAPAAVDAQPPSLGQFGAVQVP
jgi:hypothetical protein